ncbi:hypothetical protein PAXINDRAFT_182881, partial [Paxillus involutus ATCC 200175]
MSSDYDYSDEDADYYDDEDEDMMSTEEDGSAPSDDEMDMDDFRVPQRAVRKAYEVEHEPLPQSAVEKLMSADVEHISGIFGVEASTAALLLRNMNWNKERLIEKYMDNASGVSVAAGISIPSRKSLSPSLAGPERSQSASSSARSGGLRRPIRQTP